MLGSFDQRLSELTGALEARLCFPALCQAILVFFGWHFVVLPYTYFIMMKSNQKRRRDLVVYATQFGQLNLHLTVVPCAMVHTLPEKAGFALIELWHALVIWVAYIFLYSFVLDRMGMHLYPILSPRSTKTVFFYAAFVASYFCIFQGVNMCLQS